MKAFKMACPKCKSSSAYHVEVSRSYYFRKDDQWGPRVFSCMCGKQLFGLGIKEEYDRQLLAWEETLAPQVITCAWKDCSDEPRENSKYCSVACKNRYARWAYRQRKKAKR